METDPVKYLTYAEAVTFHLMLMRRLQEIRYGVFDRALLESALARPQQAAAIEGADLIRQAATLCFGLVKNHPWLGGNKRTATILVDSFLYRNGVRVETSVPETIEMVLAVEDDKWGVDEIAEWYLRHTSALP